MHMTWMRKVAWRLKTDYRYSSAIVYNTFPAASMLIKDGQTGFLIAPYETKSFANKILKVALETDIFEVMSQMAIESSKKYSPDVIFYKWKKLLSQKKYESFRRK